MHLIWFILMLYCLREYETSAEWIDFIFQLKRLYTIWIMGKSYIFYI